MASPERGGPQTIPVPDDVRPGGIPSWRGQNGPASIDDVQRALSAYNPGKIVRGPAVPRPEKQGRRSAVLVAIYDGADGPTTILTRRPQHMRKHPGEIAFPGGSHDETDESMWFTALREAEEEVALDPTLSLFAGELDSFVTGASYSLVQPIVSTLAEPPRLVASPDEVEAILTVPIRELLSPGVHRSEEWLWNGQWIPMHFFDLIGDTVWGATSLMLHNLLDVLTKEW